MKYIRIFALMTYGFIAGVYFVNSFAQEPILDPIKVAPHIFEMVFENNKVRVLKVTDRNGDTQPLHALLDRVVVHLSPCAWMNKDDNGKISMQSRKFGDVYWSNAVVRGGRTSTVIQECQSIEIEIKNHQI